MIHLLWLNIEIKLSYSMDENSYMFVTEVTTSKNTQNIFFFFQKFNKQRFKISNMDFVL